jgi:excisionase family DNA binding protein
MTGGSSDRPADKSPMAVMSEARRQKSQQQAVWLSVARAAARVGVAPRTIKRWIKRGILPATRLPSPKGQGHLRIRLGDLEALVARGTLQ